MLSYYWQWLRTAFSLKRPFLIADAVAGAISIIGPAVILLFLPEPESERVQEIMSDLAWQIPLGTLGILTLARMLLAPYLIHRQESQRVASLQEELGEFKSAPVVQIETHPFVEAGMAQLRVTNTGDVTVRCQGILHGLSIAPRRPELLPYAIKWKQIAYNPSSDPLLVMVAGGGSGILEVAMQTSSNSVTFENELRLLRSDGPDDRFRVTCKFGGELICDIEILTDPKLGKQERRAYAIVVGGQGGIVDFKSFANSGK